MKKIFIVILILAAFIGGYFFSKKYDFKIEDKDALVATPTLVPTKTTNLVGNDSDENGCKGSAGYSWCEAKQKCIRTGEEECVTENSDEKLREAILKKHNWVGSEVDITISQNDETFARGGIKEKNAISGGMFLAKKTNQEWEVVFEGNGVPDCLQLKTVYMFPKEILIGICD